ncbi:MAG: fibronectin type III domain-containing protein [Bacteroidota bacterium]
MIKKYLLKVVIGFSLCSAFGIDTIYAQVTGPQEIKWVWVSQLRNWFSNGGAEIEYGRRSRAFTTTDQLDGLKWPAENINQDVLVGQSVWIGTTNFADPVDGRTFPHKVACSGRLFIYLGSEIFPESFSLVGKFNHPSVLVDGMHASDLDPNDVLDDVQDTLKADRMIYNKIHTSIGVSMTRKVLAFTQQYNDNYYIYEYVFKNDGIIDGSGQRKLNKTLTGVIFHFQFRLGFAGESYHQGWAPTGASWGLNTINDGFGQDAAHPCPFPDAFTAQWEYYGPVSASPGVLVDIGLPHYTGQEIMPGSVMAGTKFAGVAVLYADKSPQEHINDPAQPFDTQYMGSDQDGQGVNQYDMALMDSKYKFMSKGHPAQTHAEYVGKDANGWPARFPTTVGLGDPGGYASAQGYGPYTLNPDDSIRIVIAEGINSINRRLNREIIRNYIANTPPFILPNGSTTTDRNTYKNTWVFSGKDSLFQTFRRARANYQSGYAIPAPPQPPKTFQVTSGGNKITLIWEPPEKIESNFDGYRLYRAEGRADTTYDMIFECNKNNLANSYEDRNARRGFNYFYYIQSKDDGTTNPGSAALNIPAGEPLVSSKFYTMTNHEAFLTRPSEKQLSEIRVVPNPYNIRAKDLQFGKDTPDRLAFLGLPAYCVIKIYTETGDLIQTINHISGSGDEIWNSATSSEQIVVSGLYIAYFEVTQDIYSDSGELIFRKGDNTFRKFIIIR